MIKAGILLPSPSLGPTHVLSLWSLVPMLAAPLFLNAAPVSFTIDPARSSITLSGAVIGMSMQPQAPGSLTASFAGTLEADLSDTAIAFSEPSRLRSQNSGNWAPGVNGTAGTAPAAYGAMISSFLASATAAARDLELTATSEALAIAGGAFDSSGIRFGFTPDGPSALDYSVVSPLLSDADRLNLSGLTTNDVTSMATLATAGEVQTLTIPVSATYFFSLLSDGDVRLTLAGQIVATRTVGGAPPTTLEGFLAAEFPGVTDPAVIGPAADPDQDGLPNFVEFAFALEPNTGDSAFAPLKARIDPATPGERILEFERPEGLTGISYRLDVSNDLRAWSTLPITPEITSLGNGRERVVFRDTDISAPRLIRLTVSLP
jgi:hypothetical protein